ncbi:MAG: PQQ-dependent sugar dehydrogenase [Candidatus Levybacteria bacterium]|nr:PQQ-dependent sugar dehydrogenase [Candidatus Levybacteria bacterium]
MKIKFIIFGLLLVILVLVFFIIRNKTQSPLRINQKQETSSQSIKIDENEKVKVIAGNLDTPWGITFLPDNSMLVTERKGQVRLINRNGMLDPKPVAVFNQVREIGEGGLLGIALHPNFSSNHFVYFYYTYSANTNNTFNRVARMVYRDNKLENEQVIVDRIPGASNHNGGRIKFGPDKNLYITTGDAQNSSQAQNTNSLAGKILRVTDEGKAVSGNPFNNLVYSYGHRNPQGIAWDNQGRLWATEHGRSGVLSGFDELNLVEPGKNYGWPTIEGDKARSGMEIPKLHSGPTETWAPSGMAILENSIFFAGLRGETLYEAVVKGDNIELKKHFKSQFGRIREVVLGSDNMLYITTSNRDGRGTPDTSDDRVIRINPN